MSSRCSAVSVTYEAGTGEGSLVAHWQWLTNIAVYRNVERFDFQWQYLTNKGWFVDSEGSVEYRAGQGTTYETHVNIRDDAKKYRFRVKPISKTHKVTKTKRIGGQKEVYTETEAYFSSDWSSWHEKIVNSIKLKTPSAPTTNLTYTKKRIIASVDIDLSDTTSANRPTKVVFQLYNATNSTEADRKTSLIKFNTGRASVSFDITNNGNAYRIRCFALDNYGQVSGWSNWSPDLNEEIRALPATPTKIDSLELIKYEDDSKTVELSWTYPGGKVDSYELQYTTNPEWFDTTSKVKTENPITTSWIFDLINDSELRGNTWYFRVRSINETGKSEWSQISSLTIGEKPYAPTTWSSVTTAISGDIISLYWIHNTIDGSKETEAQIRLLINGIEQPIIIIKNDRESSENIGQYRFNTGEYLDGFKLEWQVRTKGIYDEYGDWSIMRLINIVSPPVLEMKISEENTNWYWDLLNFNNGDIYTTEGELGEETDLITRYPFYISVLAAPANQSVIRWYVSIISNDDAYETLDQHGNFKTINKGDVLYSKHFDNDGDNRLFLPIFPTDVLLSNNASYRVNIKAVMNTGLSVSRDRDIDIRLGDEIIDIGSTITIDEDVLVAYIMPFATALDDASEIPLSNMFFNIFRINNDGTLTEIDSKVDSSLNQTVIDLHPTFNNVRYRIVAISKDSGSIAYEDFSESVKVSDIVIQWNERKNQNAPINSDSISDEAVISGDFLRLPWNIDISENHNQDVEFVNYIGREHPVNYHGTQKGETSTWNTDVDKRDTDVVNSLRKLAVYDGKVYVREPSGTGYWAVVQVSMSNNHAELVIPVTLSVTRVEGDA